MSDLTGPGMEPSADNDVFICPANCVCFLELATEPIQLPSSLPSRPTVAATSVETKEKVKISILPPPSSKGARLLFLKRKLRFRFKYFV